MHVKITAECSLEHSAILLTCIKLPSVFKTFVLSILSGRLRQVLLIYSSLVFDKNNKDDTNSSK